MAASLVESMGADFDPADFHDEYRDAVVELIESKKRTTATTRPAPVAEKRDDGADSMTDLLRALQASVDAARSSGGGGSGKGKSGSSSSTSPLVLELELVAVAQVPHGHRRRGLERHDDAQAQRLVEPGEEDRGHLRGRAGDRHRGREDDDPQALHPPQRLSAAAEVDQGPKSLVAGAWSLARRPQSPPARRLVPRRDEPEPAPATGTVVCTPSPPETPFIRQASPARFQMWSLVSTVIVPDMPWPAGRSGTG